MRICKNLILFPLEALLIAMIMQAFAPVLRRFGFGYVQDTEHKLERKHYITILVLFLLSVGLVLFYVFWLADFVKIHNYKWL